MWSLGMTLIETMTQALPHPESALQAARALPDPFRDMASRCLERDPKKRCSASDLRSWLKTGRAPEAPEGHVHDGSELVAPKKRVEIARPAEARTASNRTAAQPSAKPVSRYTLPAVAACLLIAAIVIMPKFFPAGNPRSPAPTQRPSEMTAAAATPPARSAPVADQGAAALPPAADPSSAAPVPEPPASNSPGAVANRVLPDISASARASLRGTVRVSVRVDVDKGGNVENAEFDARGPSHYFARKAMDAARQWKFSVPLQRGEPVASSWLLRFSFTSGGTQASAEQTAPPLP